MQKKTRSPKRKPGFAGLTDTRLNGKRALIAKLVVDEVVTENSINFFFPHKALNVEKLTIVSNAIAKKINRQSRFSPFKNDQMLKRIVKGRLLNFIELHPDEFEKDIPIVKPVVRPGNLPVEKPKATKRSKKSS